VTFPVIKYYFIITSPTTKQTNIKMAPPRRRVAADNNTPQDKAADNQQLSPEALSLAQLRQKTISHPTQQVQITMYIPPHSVGAVIGRGGRTIVSVQREAMRCNAGHVTPIRISVLNDSTNTTREDYHQQHNNNESSSDNNHVATDGYNNTTWNHNSDDQTESIDEDDEWTPVVIKGDPVGCFSACRQLVTIVEEENVPEIVLDIPILKSKHNMVVGKGGIVLAALSATNETRIMVPPNEFMSNVTGPEDNIWKQREAAQNDPGMAMLFSNNDSGNANPNIMEQPNTIPPNVIQLEGDIDKVERCLVKMLSITAGEIYTPTGVIVTNNKSETTQTKSAAAKINKEDDTYAEAVIVKIWTPNSKLLNLGKIRKVQRKTNTVIRRKKLRFRGNIDGTSSVSIVNEEGESDDDDDDDNEGGETVGEEENDGEEEEEEGEVKDDDDEVSGPKQTATKYIITGKTESVKSAATQFEKILGLEAGSATIDDTTHKVRSMANVDSGDDDGEKIGKKKRPKKKLTKEQKEENKKRKEAKIKAAKLAKKEKRLRAFARKKAQKQAEKNSSDV